MVDTQLIELAALALGDPVAEWVADANGVPVARLRSGALFQPLLENTLTDCMGDAFRLAVRLRIKFKFAFGATWAEVERDGFRLELLHEPWKDDPYAATRRAIVRAAAAMKEKR